MRDLSSLPLLQPSGLFDSHYRSPVVLTPDVAMAWMDLTTSSAQKLAKEGALQSE
ncbi:hypothetical protein MOW87_002570 [Citrobacter freundii]|uniref:hypothetical protein n=1 Tax=Citrobacter TaxID=544 RepID=UPI000AF3C2F9|nr:MULTISPECIES: hypothetical protein [Citrobacter]EIX7373175.1 hypothetical protein [Citrobacter freundii]EKU2552375.1 hypothetical protein [Citrobacter freundii]MBM7197765.1 hypothetical protein [Citrobacter freundii]MBM7203066.1 hypothetical protein [Citrobacter freundii]MBM7209937.1 hypothetical protein [Citrobacter freundii]